MDVAVGKSIDIATVPWWAVALLDGLSDDERRVRRTLQRGLTPGLRGPLADRWWSAYATLVAKARRLEEQRSLEQWMTQAYNECDHADPLHSGGPTTRKLRAAALSGVRAFGQIVGLCDDDGAPLVFENFHVRTVNLMRQSEDPAMALLPFQFGKTVLSSEVVPLMDWAEWANASELRVYQSDSHVNKLTGRLMQQVELNDNLHRVFPWVAKPVKGDIGFGIWSSEGFSIRGRSIRDKAFEAFTIGTGRIGLRAHRTGVDDVVTSTEAESVPIQQRNFDYLTAGVFTTKQRTTRKRSPYGTVFPGLYQIGTLFSMNDVNYRMNDFFGARHWPTLRFDIYPHGRRAAKERGETLWPRVMPFSACVRLEEELQDAFDKRCRNRVRIGGHIAFPMEHLRRAESELWPWGVVPENTRAMIGFDPGSGKITKDSKNPAVVVYGEQDLSPVAGPQPRLALLTDDSDRGDDDTQVELDYWENTLVHIIECHRLRGFTFPNQCEFLAGIATRLGIPIAVEDNHIQGAYAEEIRRRFPWVRTICHTTSDNKRDPRQGVETFAPLFSSSRIVIHALDAPGENIAQLRSEFAQWGAGGRYTDLVMAAWIAKFQTNLERQEHRQRQRPARALLPSYARGFAGNRRFRLVGSRGA